MKKVLTLLNDSKHRIGTVVLVYDRYDRYHSIKKMERTRRGTSDNTPSHIIVGSRNVPNYRLFLQGAANKSALAAFVCEYIASNAPSHLGENKSILLAGGFADGKVVKSLRRTGVVMVPPLFSSHEEADTRMVLHAIDLSATCTRIIIQCDDTDVLVILLYYYSKELLCREIFMQAGHMTKLRNRQRYIPVHTIGNNLGTRVCQCLPSAHALTGSDTTNAIYRIGKRTAFKVLVDHIDLLFMLSEFGVSSPFTTSLRHARMYVLLLYGKKSANGSTLDDLRYVLASTMDKTGAMLPPTEDAFKHHVLRAQFQTSIWCKSHEVNPPTFDPIGHGWKKGESGALEPTMCEKECAPLQMRDITHLFCNDEGCNVANKCPCLLAGLQCIDICSCADCPNSTTQLDLSDDDIDND